MTKFAVLGIITVGDEPEHYVSCVADNPQEAAEGWYYVSCQTNNFNPKDMPNCAHHEMLIDACYFLKHHPVGEKVDILGGDETLTIVELPDFPEEARLGSSVTTTPESPSEVLSCKHTIIENGETRTIW